MVIIQTYPMGWKVQRLDIDFVQLRHYLVKKYPQVIIPPLPLVNQKKKLDIKTFTALLWNIVELTEDIAIDIPRIAV